MNLQLINHQNSTFFISCVPGLEKILNQELEDILANNPEVSIESLKIQKGGIEIMCPIDVGLGLNFVIKSATRILLRIEKFKIRDLPKLYKKIQKVEWKQFSFPNIKLHVSASKSRIINSSKIEQTVYDALEKYFVANHYKKEKLKIIEDLNPVSHIYIRLENDVMTISLDTSDDRLDKREIEKKDFSVASIRNSFAYSLIKEAIMNLPKGEYDFHDPFCGSKTFLKEAYQLYKPINRNFNFNYFFSNIVKLKLPSLIKFNRISGSDILPIEDKIFNIIQKDATTKFKFLSPTIIVTNPPYGIRIDGTEKQTNSKVKFINKSIKNLLESENVILLSLVIPADYDIKKDYNNYQYTKGLKFRNGGLMVTNHIFKLKKSTPLNK